MRTVIAHRLTATGRRGSSRPLVAETDSGAHLLKLRGAGQGLGALIAEIIVAEIATALDLPVPARSLAVLPEVIETVNRDDELDDLLKASVGLNLGFAFLADARDFVAADIERVPVATRAEILWLDRLVINPDRTAANPNLLWSANALWLIDHGAALNFQYAWESVTETAPREPRLSPDPHLFESAVTDDDLAAADDRLAARLTRDVLEAAVGAVPEEFFPELESSQRRRAAYAAYLWKRFRAPRPFLELRTGMLPRVRGQHPGWLRR